MKPNEFEALINLGYIKPYLVLKLVAKNEEEILSMEVRLASSHTKIEAETLQELLLSHPRSEGWRGHHTMAYLIDINRLASIFDDAKVYTIIIAYREGFIWNYHLHRIITSDLSEIQYFIDHWVDDNDVYIKPSSLVYANPTREELFSSVATWKPMLLLLSDLNREDKRKKTYTNQDNLEDPQESLLM